MNWTESSLELRVITWAAGAIPTLGLPIKWGYGFSLSNRRRFSVFIMSEKNVESTGTKTESEAPSNAGIVLNESNYDVWSQLMEMHIAEGEKLSYICGNTQQPKQSEDGYEKLYAKNQKVKRWLLISMTPEIMKRYLRVPTAHEIWDALSKAFYDGSDELQVFSLNQKAFTAKQGGKSLSVYYGELCEIFRELDHRDKVVMENANDKGGTVLWLPWAVA